MAAELTTQHREFIVKKLAAFWPARMISHQLATQYGVKCSELEVLANNPATAIVAPELFMLFRSERERVLQDPLTDPYTDQKARLIVLSNLVEFFLHNNQPDDAREVLKHIMAELGIGGKMPPNGKGAALAIPEFKEITVRRTLVKPAASDA